MSYVVPVVIAAMGSKAGVIIAVSRIVKIVLDQRGE